MKTKPLNKILLLGISLSLVALPSSLSYAEDLQQKGSIKVSKFQKKEYSNLAKISLQDAVSAASKKVPGKAVEAELESEDGYLVYEVKIATSADKVTKVYVDAGNSAILGSHEESKYFG